MIAVSRMSVIFMGKSSLLIGIKSHGIIGMIIKGNWRYVVKSRYPTLKVKTKGNN